MPSTQPESTSVRPASRWRGFEVCLVNARHVKNVPGLKTDVSDCQWLQYLHSVGLLQASFRPAQQVCALRSLLRHIFNQFHRTSLMLKMLPIASEMAPQ
jgi:hypothetical protein